MARMVFGGAVMISEFVAGSARTIELFSACACGVLPDAPPPAAAVVVVVATPVSCS